MEVGMLWFDDSSIPFTQKLETAVDHYKAKYNKIPDRCYVELLPEKAKFPGLALIQDKTINKHCFWIGIHNE